MHQLHLVFQKYDAILFQIAAPFRTASRYQTRKLNSICQRLQLQNAKKREVSVGIFAITAKTGNVSKSICLSPFPGRIECLRSERGNAKVSGELMSDTRPEMSNTRPKVSDARSKGASTCQPVQSSDMFETSQPVQSSNTIETSETSQPEDSGWDKKPDAGTISGCFTQEKSLPEFPQGSLPRH